MAASTTKCLATTPYQTIGKKEFRILQIKPGRFDDKIEVDLTVHSVEEPPKYNALSYCWGRDISENTVTVNQHPVQTTSNLEEALRYLRSRRMIRTFWIDALCINQKSSLERSRQVRIMGPIYAKAAKVIVWLGSATEGSRYVMRCLRRKIVRTKSVPYFIHHVQQLMERPWFHRVWTLQEIALASDDPVLMIGHELQPLSHFLRFVKQDKILKRPLQIFEAAENTVSLIPMHWTEFFTKEILGDALPSGDGPIDAKETMLHCAHIIRSKIDRIEWLLDTVNYGVTIGPSHLLLDRGADLASSLFFTRHRHATDPRDKIFGLLGFCCGTMDGQTIEPDYRQSVSAVFSQAMALVIRRGFACGYPSMPLKTGEQRLTFSLPSWVPDFTYSDYRVFSAKRIQWKIDGFDLRDEIEPVDLCMKWGKVGFDGLPDSKPVAQFSRDFRLLHTIGAPMGAIISHHFLGHEPFANAEDGVLVLTGLYDLFKACFDGVTMTLLLSALSNPERESPCGSIAEIAMNLEDFRDGKTNLMLEAAESFVRWYKTETTGTFRGRTVFLTDAGKTGLAIGGLEQGDIVAGLFGANFPFVLRPRKGGNGYTMVSVAYVADHVFGHDFPKFDDNFDGDFTKFGLENFTIY
jgi:hypothetical protein